MAENVTTLVQKNFISYVCKLTCELTHINWEYMLMEVNLLYTVYSAHTLHFSERMVITGNCADGTVEDKKEKMRKTERE